MNDVTMPAAEAAETNEQELIGYELAFHVLPTVAEGEVSGVVDTLKTHISKAGGAIFDEEAPQRFDLAYEIVKHLEGKNRSFKSAYFGWIRFHLDPAALEEMVSEVEDEKSLLRHLVVRLNKNEEENPFYFHEALEKDQIQDVDIESADSPKEKGDEDAADDAEDKEESVEEEKEEEKSEVSEMELDEALKKEEA